MHKKLIFYLISYIYLITTVSKSLENDVVIWGPGLKPDIITMPARYFFIKIVNGNGSCVSQDSFSFNVVIQGSTDKQKPCRIWTNLLSTKDCIHIVRYKVYETCQDLTISIKHEGKHIVHSPYIIENYVPPEDCHCPSKGVDEWLKTWECGKVFQQIVNDLSHFETIDFNIIRDEIISRYGNNPRSVSLCHYVIKDNAIYRKCYGEYVGFKMFMDNILTSLTRKVVLPDLEFFVNLGDWPLVLRNEKLLPILSWCGSTESFDIIMPTYDITESTLENMGRVMLDMLSVQGNVKETWENRIPKIFWRGRDSSRERLRLIEISKEHPDLFNVSLTNFFFFRAEEEKYGKSEHVSFFSFFDYKYQLNLDGTVAAYRLPYLLAGGSLVFKQDSKYYEHFYNELIPNVHYIPIKKDLSDLVKKVKWAIDNDNEAKKIADEGRAFTLKHLMPRDIFCYHVQLLNEFSKRLVSNIEIMDGMELVTNSNSDCKCNRNFKDEL